MPSRRHMPQEINSLSSSFCRFLFLKIKCSQHRYMHYSVCWRHFLTSGPWVQTRSTCRSLILQPLSVWSRQTGHVTLPLQGLPAAILTSLLLENLYPFYHPCLASEIISRVASKHEYTYRHLQCSPDTLTQSKLGWVLYQFSSVLSSKIVACTCLAVACTSSLIIPVIAQILRSCVFFKKRKTTVF
jgi:hypothetical protein